MFGPSKITATQKQLIVYHGYYVSKAKSDGALTGQELTLRNFTDSIFETKHKESKKGKFLFSGGKAGPIGKEEYQKQVIQQQFMSEFLRTEMKSTQLKRIARKLDFSDTAYLVQRHTVSIFNVSEMKPKCFKDCTVSYDAK